MSKVLTIPTVVVLFLGGYISATGLPQAEPQVIGGLSSSGSLIPAAWLSDDGWQLVQDSTPLVWQLERWHLHNSDGISTVEVIGDTTILRPEGDFERQLLVEARQELRGGTVTSHPLVTYPFRSPDDGPPVDLWTLVAEDFATVIDSASTIDVDGCHLGLFQEAEREPTTEIWSTVDTERGRLHRASLVLFAPNPLCPGQNHAYWQGWVIGESARNARVLREDVGLTDGPYNPKGRDVVSPVRVLSIDGRYMVYGGWRSYGDGGVVLYEWRGGQVVAVLTPGF